MFLSSPCQSSYNFVCRLMYRVPPMTKLAPIVLFYLALIMFRHTQCLPDRQHLTPSLCLLKGGPQRVAGSSNGKEKIDRKAWLAAVMLSCCKSVPPPPPPPPPLCHIHIFYCSQRRLRPAVGVHLQLSPNKSVNIYTLRCTFPTMVRSFLDLLAREQVSATAGSGAPRDCHVCWMNPPPT